MIKLPTQGEASAGAMGQTQAKSKSPQRGLTEPKTVEFVLAVPMPSVGIAMHTFALWMRKAGKNSKVSSARKPQLGAAG